MKITTLKEKDLLELGFVKKSRLIHSARVSNDDEFIIGQIDDKGERKKLLVYLLPKGFRFDKHIVVNYRNEVYLCRSGMTNGGIEIYKDLNDSDFYFRETEEWKAKVKNLIEKIEIKVDT